MDIDQTNKSNVVAGRQVLRDSALPENIQLMNTWINECLPSHPECQYLGDSLLPTRVINVATDGQDPYLKVSHGRKGRYVALSYCWGTTTAAFTTTADTLPERLQRIPLASLPKTLLDAVVVTRALGVRYLWIDALCILQSRWEDDQEHIADWQIEGANMGNVYSNAWLTIAAASAGDKGDGLFMPRNLKERKCKVPIKAGGKEVDFAYLKLISYNSPLELDRRAWTFQEWILSSRILGFTAEQIKCHCRTSEVWEDGQYQRNGQDLRQILTTPKSPEESGNGPRLLELLHAWYGCLADFSERNISFMRDRLPAISGLVQLLRQQLPGEYYAGVWKTDIHRGLLWRSDQKVHFGRHLGPSWSWASRAGRISLPFSPTYSENYECSMEEYEEWLGQKKDFKTEILEVEMQYAAPKYESTGIVEHGILRVRGPTRESWVAMADDIRGEGSGWYEYLEREYYDSSGIDGETVLDLISGSALLLFDGSETQDNTLEKVVGIGYFDDSGKDVKSAICLLLTESEGLLLKKRKDNGEQFERIGIFSVYKDAWFEECEARDISII